MTEYSVSELRLASIVPKTNATCFHLLYVIEVGLREFLIRAFGTLGPRAWKERLPEDVFAAFRDAVKYEREVRWTFLVPHHPIYYIDFPDIRKTMDRGDNWRDLFKPVFRRKDTTLGTLAELEPIRNRVAHNRLLSKGELPVVEGAFEKLSSAIGGGGLRELAMHPTVAEAVPESLSRLRDEGGQALALCKTLSPVQLATWPFVRTQWWFDEDYLQHSVANVNAFFSLMESYTLLPRQRGTGHRIEAWVQSRDLDRVYHDALADFDIILAEVREP